VFPQQVELFVSDEEAGGDLHILTYGDGEFPLEQFRAELAKLGIRSQVTYQGLCG